LLKRKNENREANRILASFILLISVALLGRFFYSFTPLTLFYAKVLFIGDLVIFFYGPLLYFYYLKLFNQPQKFKVKFWVHFIPVLFFACFVTPLMFLDREGFLELLSTLYLVFTVFEIFAILQNLFYLVLNMKLLTDYEKESQQKISILPQVKFYKMLLLLGFVGLFCWIVSFILRYVGPPELANFLGYHLVWISLSLLIILLGYYSLSFPEVFSNFKLEKKLEFSNTQIKNIDEFSDKLQSLMKEEKPYLEPKLTLNDLAEKAGITSHLLSRVINEKFEKNFFEFVNNYRVEEFKSISTKDNSQNKTLLALAYESGFNSKTTFNTVFKKITHQTPREFYNIHSS